MMPIPVDISVKSVPAMSKAQNVYMVSWTIATMSCRFFHKSDHIIGEFVFSCYECIVSWKRSKYSNAESERYWKRSPFHFQICYDLLFSSCPVCKIRSAFITPSKQWFENKDDKHRLVKKHKSHLK